MSVVDGCLDPCEMSAEDSEWDEWALLMQRTATRVISKKLRFMSLRHRFWQWCTAAALAAAPAEPRLRYVQLPPTPADLLQDDARGATGCDGSRSLEAGRVHRPN